MTIRLARDVRFGREVLLEHAVGDAVLAIGEGTSIGDYCRLHVRNGEGDPWEHRAAVGCIQIGARCEVRAHVVMRSLHHLMIGDDAMLSYFCVLHAGAGTTLGDRCTVAERVTIADTDHTQDSYWTYEAPNRYAPINIGDNVLISSNAVITRGVHLGPGTVVGAGTVVARGNHRPGDLILSPRGASVNRRSITPAAPPPGDE